MVMVKSIWPGCARPHRWRYLEAQKEFTTAARREALLALHPGKLKKVLPMLPV